jgi:Las1-like
MKKQQQTRGGGGEKGDRRRSRTPRRPRRTTPSSAAQRRDDPDDRARRAARPVNAWLRARVRVAPWKSYEEFEHVGQSLLLLLLDAPAAAAASQGEPEGAPTPQDDANTGEPTPNTDAFQQSSHPSLQQRIQQALERVEVWRLRCGGPGFVPHSVESTHALAACLFEDRYPSGPTLSDATLSLMYASAITRTVNGLTDVLQQNRAVAASVAHLGRLLGLPAWIIDIRHQATHNAMPSLPILRTAAQTLLNYLDQVYWTPLRNRRIEAVALAHHLVQSHQPGDAWDGRKAGAPQSPKGSSRKVDSEDDRRMPDYYVDDEYEFVPSDDGDVDVSSDSDDDESDEPTNSVPLPHKVLGTTFNRFAALLDDTKSKKKKKNAAAEAQSDETAKEAETLPKQPSAPEPGWNSVPVDVAYRAVADHVLQYCRHITSPPSPHVSVAPPELSIFVEMSRRYPGLVGFVARELEMMDDDPTNDESSLNHGGLSFLSGREWAEYVRRVARAHGITSPSNKRPRHVASTASSSADVRDKASSILRRHGAGAPLWSNGAHLSLASPTVAAASMNQVGLEAMEALLNNAGGTNSENTARSTSMSTTMPFDEPRGGDNDIDAAATAAPVVEPSPAGEGGMGWSLCETWEPCAIGASFLGRTTRTS